MLIAFKIVSVILFSFLIFNFGLESLKDLPGVQELKAAGILDTRPAVDVYASRSQEEGVDYLSLKESAEEHEEKLEPL